MAQTYSPEVVLTAIHVNMDKEDPKSSPIKVLSVPKYRAKRLGNMRDMNPLPLRTSRRLRD